MSNWDSIFSKFSDGQSRRQQVTRLLLAQYAPNLMDEVASAGGDAFLEPLIIPASMEPSPGQSIPQTIVGLTCYPQGDKSPLTFRADVNHEGHIVLPGCGNYFVGSADHTASRVVTLNRMTGTIRLEDTGAQVLRHCNVFTEQGHIEILSQKHPFLTKCASDIHSGQRVAHWELIQPSTDVLDALNLAMHLIGGHFREAWTLLSSVARSLALFHNSQINSFASEALHGIAFLSLPKAATAPYFVEDLLHQFGHAIFGSIAFDPEELFFNSPDTRLSEFTGDCRDHRSVFVLLHGVFTEYLIAEGLLKCLEADAFRDVDRLEAEGRLLFMLKRYQLDLQSLFAVTSLRNSGMQIREELHRNIELLVDRASVNVRRLDITGQGYSFDLDTFLSRNPS